MESPRGVALPLDGEEFSDEPGSQSRGRTEQVSFVWMVNAYLLHNKRYLCGDRPVQKPHAVPIKDASRRTSDAF